MKHLTIFSLNNMINLIIVGTGAVAAEITSFIEGATYLWNNEIIKIRI